MNELSYAEKNKVRKIISKLSKTSSLRNVGLRKAEQLNKRDGSNRTWKEGVEYLLCAHDKQLKDLLY